MDMADCCWLPCMARKASAIEPTSIDDFSACRVGAAGGSLRASVTPIGKRDLSGFGEIRGPSARRDRLLAAIIVESPLRFAAEPARLDVFHEQRARPVFRIRQPLVQHL